MAGMSFSGLRGNTALQNMLHCTVMQRHSSLARSLGVGELAEERDSERSVPDDRLTAPPISVASGGA